MKTISLIFIFLCLQSHTSANASVTNLNYKLSLRNELLISTREVKDFLFDQDVKRRLDEWLNNVPVSYIHACRLNLKPFIPSLNILDPLCYVLRQNPQITLDNGRPIRSLYKALLRRFILETKTALDEISQDPRYASLNPRAKALQKHAAQVSKLITTKHFRQMLKCFLPAQKITYSSNPNRPNRFLPFSGIKQCLDKLRYSKIVNGQELVFFPVNLVDQYSIPEAGFFHPGHAISETGWLAGNHVDYYYWNDHTIDRRELAHFRDALKDIEKKLQPGESAYQYFLNNNPKELFQDPIYRFESHPAWKQNRGIFGAIKKAIRSAKTTIFQDVFFLGGSMGISLLKEYQRLLEQNKDLQIFIIKDQSNFFGYKEEIDIVFDYALALSHAYPDRLVVAESYIMDHTSGLPPLMQDFIETDQFVAGSGLKQILLKRASDKADLYVGAKADHSKVLVIDGSTTQATAIVGSKNFTDSSGPVCFDDIVLIQGPAANVVADDFYYDMYLALEKNMLAPYSTTLRRRDPQEYKKRVTYNRYMQRIFKRGWSRDKITSSMSQREKIIQLLRPFDLLNRDKNFKARLNYQIVIPHKASNMLLRTGFNNVDSTRTNIVDQVLQMIQAAKNYIYIQDQFLFDRNIIWALIQAKNLNPQLKVKVILEGFLDSHPKGTPNNLYLNLLEVAGVEVRRMNNEHQLGISEEFHHKTISADGKCVIVGSANKDQTTMYGSFREQQIDVCNQAVTLAHDKVFRKRFESNKLTSPFRAYDFDLKYLKNIKDFNGQPMTPKSFIHLLQNLISILFDAKTI